MTIDPYILTFSALTVIATIYMGFWSARKSKTASDFFVAGRSVSVGWNASAISGEYLSAASFMGVAGMVMSSGYDALWYPVCYACGYLFLLLFIAGPLRRFGAYTIPDFAEGRFDSPVFRKIAVVFVLFIGFFYTMPQMKGAGTTLAYIFPGLPYWAGVVLVGAVITLNVALGGMKGITLVQAFQYWAKMFAISVPIFVLMAVYGHYGKQVGLNGEDRTPTVEVGTEFKKVRERAPGEKAIDEWRLKAAAALPADALANVDNRKVVALGLSDTLGFGLSFTQTSVLNLCQLYGKIKGKDVFLAGIRADYSDVLQPVPLPHTKAVLGTDALRVAETALTNAGFILFRESRDELYFARANLLRGGGSAPISENFLVKFEGQTNEEPLQRFGCVVRVQNSPSPVTEAGSFRGSIVPAAHLISAWTGGRPVFVHTNLARRYSAPEIEVSYASSNDAKQQLIAGIARFYQAAVLDRGESVLVLPGTIPTNSVLIEFRKHLERAPLPAKAPTDATWLNPFGPLTTKAAKNAAAAIGKKASAASPHADIGPTLDLPPLTAEMRDSLRDFKKRLTVQQAVYEYAQLAQRTPLRSGSPFVDHLDQFLKGRLSSMGLVRSPRLPTNVIEFTSSTLAGSAWPGAASSNVYNAGMSLGLVRGSGQSSAAFVSRSGPSVMANAYEVAAKSFSDIFIRTTRSERAFDLWAALNRLDVELVPVGEKYLTARMREKATRKAGRAVLSAPDRGVTLGAAVAGAARRGEDTAPYPAQKQISLRADLSPDQHMTVNLDSPSVSQALAIYADLTGRQLLPNTNSVAERADDLLAGALSKWKFISRAPAPDSGVRIHNDGAFTAAEVKSAIEAQLWTNGLVLVAVGEKGFRVERAASVSLASSVSQQDAGGTLGADAERAWLAKHEKPLALLYTYSLIMALVCGTAGLPHILVRFYTNPDGVAAKKTTMWVMILIGVFYVFPPVFGVMGRNLLPSLYAGTGAKGTDKVVLELPRILNDGQSNNSQFSIPNSQSTSPSADPALRNENLELKNAPLKKRGIPWGSILSGITCAGAFAAFMSTFSGLLVSMTGALAHDVYGRMLRPKATPEQRLRMFKICAVIIGGVAILLGTQVEPLQINFMVGQAFAIAAASYFPLLFMSVWWRGMTMKGAAVGMLAGGICALAAVTLTNFSDLKWIDLADFWAAHPLARIICEQPAIWTVPLAIGLMVVVSKLTQREVPSDVRMKMLVLHAPEQLGLKQEYIQEHQHGH